MEIEPELVYADRNGSLTRDGITVDISVYKLASDPEWVLEVVNANGTSIIWEETFATADAAFIAFDEAVEEDGMETFLDDPDVAEQRKS